jgi:exopolyphosphatase/guanosine-5'-triphosphate,3'-diphosphate pyrophosphatase
MTRLGPFTPGAVPIIGFGLNTKMSRTLASIDLGTHTARLLIARWDEASHSILPMTRQRSYIRLGSDFHRGNGILSEGAARRVLDVLRTFERSIRTYRVEMTVAVATGVVRQAENREEFLRLLGEGTGIRIRAITGEEEARLTAGAVHRVLHMENKPHLIVDLGGGSTEFVLANWKECWIRSIPLGASILTEEYLKTDPPKGSEIDDLRDFVGRKLMNGLDQVPSRRVFSMAGTGGTIVTLGALLHNISIRDLDPHHVTGLTITKENIQELFEEMITMKRKERVTRYGLDTDRAGVLPAGALLTAGIMDSFSLETLTVCFSDLLEGLLWEHKENA